MVELHLTDDVAQRGGGEVFDGGHRALHAVGEELRVRDLEEHDGVDLHGDVITRDDGLGLEVHDLLLEGDFLGNAVNERDLEVEARAPRRAVNAHAFHNEHVRLRDDTDVGDGYDHGDQDQRKKNVQ